MINTFDQELSLEWDLLVLATSIPGALMLRSINVRSIKLVFGFEKPVNRRKDVNWRIFIRQMTRYAGGIPRKKALLEREGYDMRRVTIPTKGLSLCF